MPLLADLTWPEARALLARTDLALVPVGSTEAHGPHLPLLTDALIAAETARRAALRLEAEHAWPAAVAPTLPYAVTEVGSCFPGTVSVSADTVAGLARDVCVSLARQGFRRQVVVNAHLEPAHVEAVTRGIAEAARATGARIAFPDKRESRHAATLTEEFRRGARHGGAYETSLVLAVRPDAVREAERRALAPVWIDLPARLRAGARTFAEAGSPLGYFGDPARATAAEGEATYEALTAMVVGAALELRAG